MHLMQLPSAMLHLPRMRLMSCHCDSGAGAAELSAAARASVALTLEMSWQYLNVGPILTRKSVLTWEVRIRYIDALVMPQ